jgi:hypothetical protein
LKFKKNKTSNITITIFNTVASTVVAKKRTTLYTFKIEGVTQQCHKLLYAIITQNENRAHPTKQTYKIKTRSWSTPGWKTKQYFPISFITEVSTDHTWSQQHPQPNIIFYMGKITEAESHSRLCRHRKQKQNPVTSRLPLSLMEEKPITNFRRSATEMP